MKRKYISLLISIVSCFILSTSLVSSADGLPRDPNGDGFIDMSDAICIDNFLTGSDVPINLTSLDVDQNNVITPSDSLKIQLYSLGLINLPPSNSNDPLCNIYPSSRNYRRHDCLSNNNASYSQYSLSLIPYQNVFPDGLNSIIGENDLVPCTDTSVVWLSTGGSGFIVGNHVIATAAHCVYSKEDNEFYDVQVKIINSNSQLIQTINPRYIHIPSNYATFNNNNKFDYALIYVSENLSNYGRFKLGYPLNNYITAHKHVNVAGFPGTGGYPYENQNDPWGERYQSEGQLQYDSQSDLTDGRLYYDADTYPGDSGGPVYINESFYGGGNVYENKVAIGIHTNGGNSGVRINEMLLKFYCTNEHLIS